MSVAPEINAASLEPETAEHCQVDLDSMNFLRFVIALNQQVGVDMIEVDYQKVANAAQ